MIQPSFTAGNDGHKTSPRFTFLSNPDTGFYFDPVLAKVVFVYDAKEVLSFSADGLTLENGAAVIVAGGSLTTEEDLLVTDDLTVGDDLAVGGDVFVNTDKFTVAGASGNTVIGGTGTVTGNLTVGDSKMVVTASSGATAHAGLTITETGAGVFNAGRLGATSPALQVVGNIANSITGVKITPAASGSGVAVDALGGTNEAMTISAKGTGLLVLQGGATGSVHINDALKVTGGVTVADIDAAVTANVGSSQGTGEAITKFFTNISVCAVAGDAVTLPDAPVAGQIHIIANSGAESADVFPNTDDTIDGGSANAAVAIAAGKRRIFIALSTTAWISILGA